MWAPVKCCGVFPFKLAELTKDEALGSLAAGGEESGIWLGGLCRRVVQTALCLRNAFCSNFSEEKCTRQSPSGHAG